MQRFQYRLFTDLLIPVLLMALYVFAGDEDCLGFAGQSPVNCYKCESVTDSHYCSDPFNESYPGLEQIRCKEYCVKWTRQTLGGKTLVQRTCSDQLQITIRKNVVCMQESRPSEGILCFCDKDKCNAAFTLHHSYSLPFVLVLQAFAHIIARLK